MLPDPDLRYVLLPMRRPSPALSSGWREVGRGGWHFREGHPDQGTTTRMALVTLKPDAALMSWITP